MISDTYDYDYDIVELDRKINKLFEEQQKQLSGLKNDIERLEYIRDHAQDVRDADIAIDQLKIVRDTYDTIFYRTKQQEYKMKIRTLLEKYAHLSSIERKIVFGMEEELDDVSIQKLNVIAEYLNIVKDYFPINIVHKSDKPCMQCPLCGQDMVQANCTLICNCGHMIEEEKENTKHSKCGYDKKKNFTDIMNAFQGKNCKNIPKRVYDIIYKQLERYKIQPKNLTKARLHMILKEQKLPNHYININKIHTTITGIPPPNISKYENAILNRYSLYLKVYEEDIDTRRNNSLNNQYLLYTFLRMEGYDCDPEDFSTLKTRLSLLEHDAIMKQICAILAKRYPTMNWEFVEVA